MTEVRCGFTSCKNNKQKKDGHFCKVEKEISLVCHFSSLVGVNKMECEQYKTKKGYAR